MKVNINKKDKRIEVIVSVPIRRKLRDKKICIDLSVVREFLIEQKVKFGKVLPGYRTLQNGETGSFCFEILSPVETIVSSNKSNNKRKSKTEVPKDTILDSETIIE